jgi:rubrerythrin
MGTSEHGEIGELDLELGDAVFDADGTKIGTIRGFDQAGIYLTLAEGVEVEAVEEVRSGAAPVGDAAMWRCWECGEMGKIDGDLPAACPDCGASREELYYWVED